jgi:hypothetical protein
MLSRAYVLLSFCQPRCIEDFYGVHYGNVGVYMNEGGTYAGEHEGGKAHGYGVFKVNDWDDRENGYTYSGQFANGLWHGHGERHVHDADGDVGYLLREHGNPVHYARVGASGTCEFDGEPCGADHAGLVALKAAAQQAAVRNAPSRIPARSAAPWPKPQRVFVFPRVRFSCRGRPAAP